MGSVEEESPQQPPVPEDESWRTQRSSIPINQRWSRRQQERERLGITEKEKQPNEQSRFFHFLREGIEHSSITFGEDGLPVEKGPTSIHHAIKQYYRPEVKQKELPVAQTPMHQMTDKEKAYFGSFTNRVRAEVGHRNDALPQDENSMHRLVKRLNKKIRSEGIQPVQPAH